MSSQSSTPPEVFVSYSSKDKRFKDELLKQLKVLAQQDIISTWHDGLLVPGQQWNAEIVEHLNSSRVILLLISPDFLTSDYVNKVELKVAADRHKRKEACVIPVLVRNVNAWKSQPFGDLRLGDLQAVPTGEKFVVEWNNRNKAFADVAQGIQESIETLFDRGVNKFAYSPIPRPPIVGFVPRGDPEGHDMVERLKIELAPQKLQLVALWGAGGVGKTTLAAEVARSLSDDFSHRVVWVTADGRTDLPFATLLDEIATQLGDEHLRKLAPERKSDAVRALVAASPTLIVLDNFETISAAQRQPSLDFLQRIQCSALITTRQRLERTRSIPITGMMTSEAEDFVRLLIEQTQDPEIFAAPYQKRLIETAEANPLIMEWIVGQIDLANDPEEVLNELTHGEGDAARRVFDRSYNLTQLNDGGRAVLLALSLFTPSAARPALAAIAGMDLGKARDKKRFKKAQETLASLWLIKKVDEGQRLTVAGLTRELTRSHLTTDAREKSFFQRFVSRFLRFAEAHALPISKNFNAMELEKDNLLSAAEIALVQGDSRSLLRLAYAFGSPAYGVLAVRGYWDDLLRLGTNALQVARSLGVLSDVANWTHKLGMMNQDLGLFNDAQQLYEESLETRRVLGDDQGVADTLHQLGWLAQEQGKLEEARQLYDQSLEIRRQLGDQRGIASALHHLGWLAQERGEFGESRRLYNESLEIKKQFDDQLGIATTLHQLGGLHLIEENYDMAQLLLEQSLVILRNVGHKQYCAECLESIGKLRTAQGRLAEAEGLFVEAGGMAGALGDQVRVGSIKRSLGLLAEKQNNESKAVQLLRDALSIFEQLGSPKAEETRRDLERVKGTSS